MGRRTAGRAWGPAGPLGVGHLVLIDPDRVDPMNLPRLVAARPLLPGVRCMWCDQLIDSTDLATDSLPHAMRAQGRYVADVPAASVLPFNAIAAADAATYFMQAVTGLHAEDRDHDTIVYEPRHRTQEREAANPRPTCRWCLPTPGSALAVGDSGTLPVLSRAR